LAQFGGCKQGEGGIAMAIIVPNPNVLLDGFEDKIGHIMYEIRKRLLATGLWRVRGSGTGCAYTPTLDGFSAVQLMGQTAGVSGSFDLFQAATWLPFIEYNVTPTWYMGGANTFSRASAWIVLEEIVGGRCLILFRPTTNVDSNGTLNIRFCPNGVASSGATAILPPAPVGSYVTNGSPDGLYGYSADLQRSINQLWFQMGVADAPEAGNVCPFWIAIYNRTLAKRVWGMLYESLVDTVAGDAHPYIIGARGWGTAYVFFDSIVSTGYNSALLFGGGTAGSRQLSGVSVGSQAFPNSTQTYPQPIGPDGYWRSQAPFVYTAVANTPAYVGRCKNILLHPINRDYPSTYNVGTPQSRLALGQILVPWAVGVAPGSSP
jgi:hypothetical protein